MLKKRSSCCLCKHSLPRDISCYLAVYFKLVNIYMLTKPLSSTIPEVFYKKVFLYMCSWYVFIKFKTRDKTCLEIKETWCLLVCWAAIDSKLILLCHFHKKLFQKKTVISEKCSFFGQSLFLSHGKPGLNTSRLYFSLFENHELRFKGK